MSQKNHSAKDISRYLISDEFSLVRKVIYIILFVLSMIGTIALFSCPLCDSLYLEGKVYSPTPGDCFDALNSGLAELGTIAKIQFGAFVLISLAIAVNAILLIKALLSITLEEKLSKTVKRTLGFNFTFIVIFTVVTFLLSPINIMVGGKLLGGISTAKLNVFPLVYALLPCLLYAVFSTLLTFLHQKNDDRTIFEKQAFESIAKKRKTLFFSRIELMTYAMVSAALTLVALLTNFVSVTISKPANLPTVKISGWWLLTDVATQTAVPAGKRLLTFVVFLCLVLTLIVVFLTIVAYIGRSRLFGKLSVLCVTGSSVFSLIISMIGKYYDMVQQISYGLLIDRLSKMGNYGDLKNTTFTYTINSHTIYFFLGTLVIIAVLLIRHPYSKVTKLAKEIAIEEEANKPKKIEISGSKGLTIEGGAQSEAAKKPAILADPCPAFTAIDEKIESFSLQLEERRSVLFDSPTLPKLVDFIVQYARDSRLHLFYTHESIAEFLAGLGTTRLTILQGMSGTGKTSLPKIVSEALSSVCDIVEVESSWRDKNELLGYYNEFSKIFTPKKFTEALYRATLNAEIPTFIVLDEMNLSRIEYYFSDFLSLMEHEPDKRMLKLLNTPLFRTNEDGGKEEYLGLTDGCVLKIPPNVWFIGTANRDESTYDISDKVYDRAHTMNFDKRAEKLQYLNDALQPQYMPINTLLQLFDDAKQTVNFNMDQFPVIAEVEKLLSPYNISFGNRIAMQIESFVKIYAACFDSSDRAIKDALEIILLSKVVRKLELKTIDDKDELAAAFAKLQLPRCSEFILSIKED